MMYSRSVYEITLYSNIPLNKLVWYLKTMVQLLQ